ncbi:MAG: acyloxyacyl hydrolase [Saprospiraceae bacterium]|nr:acyloxyacyl hydrolase [Pyrinomonadaceae bacterium]
MKAHFVLVIFLIILAAGIRAQDDEPGKNEISVWGGYSPDSTVSLIGRTPDARFGIIALRYARRFNNSDSVNLKYTADVIPAAFLNYRDAELLNTVPPSARLIRPTRYAFGAAPLGLQINFRPRKRVQPFLGTSGGFLIFSRQTPNFVGTRFNFTADLGGGVEFRLKEKRALTLGYKYYHISNAERGLANPGFDNNLIYVGYTFFSK